MKKETRGTPMSLSELVEVQGGRSVSLGIQTPPGTPFQYREMAGIQAAEQYMRDFPDTNYVDLSVRDFNPGGLERSSNGGWTREMMEEGLNGAQPPGSVDWWYAGNGSFDESGFAMTDWSNAFNDSFSDRFGGERSMDPMSSNQVDSFSDRFSGMSSADSFADRFDAASQGFDPGMGGGFDGGMGGAEF